MGKEAASIRIETQQTSADSRCDAAETHAAATPAMQQYLKAKASYPDCLLFYRMGDFYELFFDDAVTASAILDIALTKRGKYAGEDVQMCGVPVHAAEGYLQKLIASGLKIAICEQMETPEEAKTRGYKAVVRREVVRVVTPGTITEETLLAPEQSHFLACLTIDSALGGMAWLDLSTGEFTCAAVPLAAIPAMLARLQPRELLLSHAAQDALSSEPWFQEWRGIVAARPDLLFDARKAERSLVTHYQVAETAVLADFSDVERIACGVLLDYLHLTQMQAVPRLDIPRQERAGSHLQMDAPTRRNLELTQTLAGTRRGSLLATLDCTVTAAGGRLLFQQLSAPLGDLTALYARQEAVHYAREAGNQRGQWRALLKTISDMERGVGRLALGRGGPRDLRMLATSLQNTNTLHEHLRGLDLPALLGELRTALAGHHALADALNAALKTEVPHLVRDGNFIADGFRADLDEWRRLRDESKRIIAVMEQQLKTETTIPSLKIKHNNVLGYFIEITPIHEKKVPAHFIHRQGLAGALRYSTKELGETAGKIQEAGEKALQLELMLFEELRQKIITHSEGIIAAARALAQLDVFFALAERAEEGRWVRPTLTHGAEFEIIGGRHPVVEAALRRTHQEFIANDCDLGTASQLWLITGPNMGGKSTFLRQQAIILVLAQLGSFVPAESVTIGVADKLFCRVGAADDLARGQSTFMVEMVETASILHQATEKSLVVLDEIGRGTSTYDGVSIAWAVAEHIHNITCCRALFATHYHELTDLLQSLPRLRNYQATAKEYKGQLVFMHTISAGFADKSYGIHVAAMAGMPQPVLARAKKLLQTLQSGHSLTEQITTHDLPLFNINYPPQQNVIKENDHHKFIERIENLDVDNLTPRDALNLLADWKREVQG